MDISELKLRIFREIDSLEQGKLQEVYGYLQNIVRGEKELGEWESLSTAQKGGIQEAITELEEGKGLVNEEVITKYRKKYSDD
jgi:hypothetical protein